MDHTEAKRDGFKSVWYPSPLCVTSTFCPLLPMPTLFNLPVNFYSAFPFAPSMVCAVLSPLRACSVTAAAITAPFTASVCKCVLLHLSRPLCQKQKQCCKKWQVAPLVSYTSLVCLHNVSHKDSQRHSGFESLTLCTDTVIFLSLLSTCMCDLQPLLLTFKEGFWFFFYEIM